MSKIQFLRLFVAILLLILKLNISSAYAGQKHVLSREWTAIIESPVMVALSEVGEKRWGWYQFPALSELPDGDIICIFSHQQDAVSGYGKRPKCYVSGDGGNSWDKAKENYDKMLALPHGTISKVKNGEFLCVPPVQALDVNSEKDKLPEPAGKFTFKSHLLYRVAECPSAVRKYIVELDGWRWSSDNKTWAAEKVFYDERRALAWASIWENKQKIKIPRTWFEHRLLKLGEELLYADYRQVFEEPDGYIPKNDVVSLMVSTDNGHRFSKRGTIALDRTGEVSFSEPCLSATKDGHLVCAMRRQKGNWKSMMPMAISFSSNRGRTWEIPKSFDHLGVFPTLVLLDNGVLVLAYGRPGVHLIFSLDGTGREWTEPITLRQGDNEKWLTKTCGYTSIVTLSDNEFLIAYSDFEHKDEKGQVYKAILVGRVKLERPNQY